MLERYLSALRSILQWLRCSQGTLAPENTTRVVKALKEQTVHSRSKSGRLSRTRSNSLSGQRRNSRIARLVMRGLFPVNFACALARFWVKALRKLPFMSGMESTDACTSLFRSRRVGMNLWKLRERTAQTLRAGCVSL